MNVEVLEKICMEKPVRRVPCASSSDGGFREAWDREDQMTSWLSFLSLIHFRLFLWEDFSPMGQTNLRTQIEPKNSFNGLGH